MDMPGRMNDAISSNSSRTSSQIESVRLLFRRAVGIAEDFISDVIAIGVSMTVRVKRPSVDGSVRTPNLQ